MAASQSSSASPTVAHCSRRWPIDGWLPRIAYVCTPRGLLLGLLLLGAIAAGTLVGAVKLPIWNVLLGHEVLTDMQKMVLSELRLPRVLLALGVGAALASSGAVMQGLFRNPLAEAQLIGVSAGAALGAITVIVLGDEISLPTAIMPFSVSLGAIGGAFAVTAGLYAVARRLGSQNITTMLLLGIAINAIAGVGIGIFTWLANDGELRSLTFWTMGSFGGAQWITVIPALALMGLALGMMLPAADDLDRLQLGELEAKRLGVSVQRLKRRMVLATAIGVGAAVSIAGMIGFIGLVVPHIARLIYGVHHRVLLPTAAVLGAVLTIVADVIARTTVAPAELPVGLLTSAMGAPFFLWLIIRVKQR